MENRKPNKNWRTFPAIVRIASLLFVVSLLCHYNPSEAHYIQIEHNDEYHHHRGGLPPLPIVDQHLPPAPTMKELTPVEFVADLTNDLTYRILHYHSILNRNNFAFSPTALMSILVALYEGSAGRSALELKNVLQFPDNKDVLRVGYRDIHRRLRTYFFGSENPLKGLSLNKENVTVLRDFENVLMFYGYDLGMDMVSSVATTLSTPTTASSVETTATTTMIPEVQEITTTSITTTSEPTTTPADSTTTETPLPTTMEISTTPSSETTTETPTTTTEVITTTPPTTTTTTTEAPEVTTPETEPTTEPTTESPTTTESTAETETEPRNGDEAELISTGTGEQFSRLQRVRVTRLPSGRLQAPPRPQTTPRKQTAARSQSIRLPEKSPTLRNDYLPATSRTFQSERLSSRQTRPKRHLFGSFREADENLFVTLFHPHAPPPPPAQFQHGLYGLTGTASGPSLNHVHEFEVDVEPHFITGPSGGGGGVTHGSEHKPNYNTDIISHIFYLGGQEVIYTTYKVYNAVLYFKYFDHLKMSVLELELDTSEYNLMILLPDYHTDLVGATASLHLGPTLRELRKQLKPRWVQAIIPDFKLNGAMFLTNDLQNLGICDIFEPNRADFRPMTDEKGIYVKHIEQSINVNIRTHPINQLRRNQGATQLHPIQISVNHPFLFFIIDRDLDVAVMAGRILNPLNVRIQ